MGAYTIDNTLREKWSGRQTAEVENFDGKNVDELIKIHQIRQFSPIKIFCHTVFHMPKWF